MKLCESLKKTCSRCLWHNVLDNHWHYDDLCRLCVQCKLILGLPCMRFPSVRWSSYWLCLIWKRSCCCCEKVIEAATMGMNKHYAHVLKLIDHLEQTIVEFVDVVYDVCGGASLLACAGLSGIYSVALAVGPFICPRGRCNTNNIMQQAKITSSPYFATTTNSIWLIRFGNDGWSKTRLIVWWNNSWTRPTERLLSLDQSL